MSESTPPPQNNLQRALNGEYDFSIASIFGRANEMVKLHYPLLMSGCAVLILICALLLGILFSQYPVETLQNMSPEQQIMLDIAGVFLTAPIITGLILLSARLSAGGQGQFSQLFQYIPSVLVLAIGQLLISMLVQLGLWLLLLPGIYLFVASSFTLPLIADKKLSIVTALILSCRVVNKYLLGFAGLFAVFILLAVLVVFTLGVALLWVMPLYYAALGLLYQDLFAQDGQPAAPKAVATQRESTFDA